MEIIKADNYEDIRFLNDNYAPKLLDLLKEKNYESISKLANTLSDNQIYLSDNKLRKVLKILSSYEIIKLTKLGNEIFIERVKDKFTLKNELYHITFGEKEVLLLSESIKGYSNLPINPENFANEVISKLKSYNQIVPIKMTIMAKELCRVFNECIKYNKQKRFPEITESGKFRMNISNDAYKTFVVSPRTGSAKTLSLKTYISMLKKESSLIILKDVDDVNQFCKDVNEWSGDMNYARCHYSINQDNLKSEFHVLRSELAEYKCIVITHSLFKQLKHQNKYDSINVFDNKKRNLIVIDERISFYKHYKITKEDLENTEKFIYQEQLYFKNNHLKFEEDLKDEIVLRIESLYSFVKSFYDIFLNILEYEIKNHNYEFIFQNQWDSFDDYLHLFNLEEYYETIDSCLFLNFEFNFSLLSQKELNKIINEQRKRLKLIIESMFYIIKNASILETSGQKLALHSINEYHNDFASYVVLDATAHINAYYNFASKSIYKNLKHIKTTNPKRYDNLTFHIARGYAQGRSSIYKNTTKDLLHEVKRYLHIANNIIHENDKLLILGHKDFIVYLEKYSKDKRIFFTHWGRHIGKNEWSECNKVIVIGWNYLPKIEHYLTLASANNGFDNAYDETVLKYRKLISTVAVHQVADDIIQGISRGALRNTIDEKGNCPICEVYILAKWKDEQTDKVLNIVTNEFDNSTVKSWYPKDIGTVKKKTKPQIKINKIINHVSKKLQNMDSVDVMDVKKELGISNSTFHRIANKEFEDLCLTKNIIYGYYNKKCKNFTKAY